MPAVMGINGRSNFLPGAHMLPEVAWVYILMGETDDAGFMKIGCSGSPVQRWKSLAVEGVHAKYMPHVKYAAVYKARTIAESYKVEALLHRKFAARKIESEWFRFDFRNKADKQEFNAGCRQIIKDGWWEKFSFEIAREFC